VKLGRFALAICLVATGVLLACTDIPTGDDDLLSFEFAPLPSPSVVVGDTLRDTLGVVGPLRITAFNFAGDTIAGASVRYRPLDARIRVDSVTGIVIGDSASLVSSRILAVLDDIEGFITIPVVLRPDTLVASNDRDTLSYSLTDTTVNVSTAMGVRVLHGPALSDSAVRSYRVTFEVISSANPALSRFIDEAGRTSSADTSDVSGAAGRRVRVDVTKLTAAIDSVVMRASVRYRGQHIRGSPLRLVLELKPR